jgi:hypothetical protein
VSISNRLALLVIYVDLACRRQRVIGITLQQVLFGTTNWPTPIARSYAAVTSQVAERSVAHIGDRLRPVTDYEAVAPLRRIGTFGLEVGAALQQTTYWSRDDLLDHLIGEQLD